MTTADLILLDTNVLVYGQEKQSRFFESSRILLEKGFAGMLPLCVSPQILMEFHSTVTNPKRVTKAVPVADSLDQIKEYLVSPSIRKIYPSRKTLSEVLRLIEVYQISRQEIYDAQLVATMLSNGVTRICTYNVEHFKKYKEIEVVTP